MDKSKELEVVNKEEVIVTNLTPEQQLKSSLLLAIQRNVFFDAVLASIAYTLLEEAYRTSEELRKYPYEDIDIAKVNAEELKDFKIVSTVINEYLSLDELLKTPEVIVSWISNALRALLYTADNNTGRFVAGTLRVHLVADTGSGTIGIQIIAIKHDKEVA